MIDEIQIENSDVQVEAETIIDEPVVEIVNKKGRGRPKGVVNKQKAEAKIKATAKKKTIVQEYEDSDEEEPIVKIKKKTKKKTVVYEEESEEEQPQYNTRDIASEVINMLSNRHLDRSAQKREKYRSWFN